MFDKINKAIKSAKSKGADQVEIFAIKTISNKTCVRNQSIEELKTSENIGFSVRVIKNKSLGFAFSSVWDKESLSDTIDKALKASQITTPDKYNLLPSLSKNNSIDASLLKLYDSEIINLSKQTRIGIAQEIESTAYKNKKITKTEMVTFSDTNYEIFLANSEGIKEHYQGTYCGGTAEVIAGTSDTASEAGFGIDYKTCLKDFDPQKVGKEAAKQASMMLNAQSISTQKLSIVFSPIVSMDFLEVITPMLLADNGLKGKSLLWQKEGETIASAVISIIDNGCLPEAIGSAPFDGEGLPTQETVIIEKGILKTFLYDYYSALKAGRSSTGNSDRNGFMSLPRVGSHNIYFKPGAQSESEIINQIDNGFYVTKVMGMHTANPISGDFSLGASGLIIKKGQLDKPVCGVAIAGNLFSLLKQIVAVGSNLRFILGIGAPTINVGELTVSGT